MKGEDDDIELPKELRMDAYDDEYEEDVNSDDNDDMIDETEEFEVSEYLILLLQSVSCTKDR